MKTNIYLLLAIFCIPAILSAQETNRITVKKIINENLNAEENDNIYRAIKIGEQTWTMNTIKDKRYSDGESIPLIADSRLWDSVSSDAYRVEKSTETKIPVYKYNGYAIETGKLCPAGWRAATTDDYRKLALFLKKDSASFSKYSHMVDTTDYSQNAGRPVRCIKK